MPFEKNHSKSLNNRGNHIGIRQAKHVALSEIVHQMQSIKPGQDKTRLERVITRLWDLAEKGDPLVSLAAVKELLDRIVGKPIAAVEISGQDGGPVRLQVIEPGHT